VLRANAFRGFPWWLPLLTALLGVLCAVALSGAAAAGWAAGARVWIQADAAATDALADLFSDPLVLETALDLNASSWAAGDLAAAAQLSTQPQLLTVTVTAGDPTEAENLAMTLAGAAVDEYFEQTSGEIPVQVLGLAWPGAQRTSPPLARDASIAAAAGLLGGIALAAGPRRRPAASPPSSLARWGRRGGRRLAGIAERQSGAGGPPRSAVQLADALAAAPAGGPATLFLPLHDSADAGLPALQAARALAGRGLAVLWLDLRAEQPVLLGMPNQAGAAPSPAQPVDPAAAPLPRWLHGLAPPPWDAQLRRLLAANRPRFDAVIIVAGPRAADRRDPTVDQGVEGARVHQPVLRFVHRVQQPFPGHRAQRGAIVLLGCRHDGQREREGHEYGRKSFHLQLSLRSEKR